MSIDVQSGGWENPRGIKYVMGTSLLKMMGWKMDKSNLPACKKMVIIAAPHTSNWDLPLMLACSYVSGLKISWLGKDTIFRGPGGGFFKWLGGIPVDRSAATGMVAQVADVFKQRDTLAIAIPPAGTRRYTEGWKTGFYYIAHQANVPIVMSYLDWSRKVAGYGPALHPTGDIEADFEIFREFYKDKIGKFPEHTSPIRVRTKRAYKQKTEEKPGMGRMLVDVYRSMLSKKALEG